MLSTWELKIGTGQLKYCTLMLFAQAHDYGNGTVLDWILQMRVLLRNYLSNEATDWVI
jgi:hypothetical protein